MISTAAMNNSRGKDIEDKQNTAMNRAGSLSETLLLL